MKKGILILRFLVAAILLQTLFYKFLGHEDSKYIFESISEYLLAHLGINISAEPYGRVGLGILELITAVLLILPRTVFYGGIMTVGLMLGAIMTHLLIIGVSVKGDNGLLFSLAIICLIGGSIVTCSSCKKILQKKTP